jgi:hypothetical protein
MNRSKRSKILSIDCHFEIGEISLNALSDDPAQTHLHRDLIRKADFRVPEGMVIVDLGVCDTRDGHEWT